MTGHLHLPWPLKRTASEASSTASQDDDNTSHRKLLVFKYRQYHSHNGALYHYYDFVRELRFDVQEDVHTAGYNVWKFDPGCKELCKSFDNYMDKKKRRRSWQVTRSRAKQISNEKRPSGSSWGVSRARRIDCRRLIMSASVRRTCISF